MRIMMPAPVQRYAEAHTAPESAVLRSLVRETYAKARAPHMQVGHLEGAFLRLLARLTRARRVLEIGTFTGYSALAMAEGMPPGGRLWTLDIDPAVTALARRFWRRSPHGRKIRLVLGPALESLRRLKGPFDLVFIDADKEGYPRYWDACVPKVRKWGVLAVDNTLRSGRVLGAARDGRMMRAFNRKVLRDRRVEPLLLPIRDGVTVACRL